MHSSTASNSARTSGLMSSRGRPWHSLSGAEALADLSSGSQGLAPTEATARLTRHGPNRMQSGKGTSISAILVHQIASPLIYVLLGAMAVTLAIGEYSDSIVIGVVILINGIVGFSQEYRAENAMQALLKLTTPRATVRRAGQVMEIDSTELVPGDIVLLDTGQVVPADCRLLDTSRLLVDESLLTGESVPSQKVADVLPGEHLPVADQENMAFMGSAVVSGKGTAVIVATAGRTQMGSIAEGLMSTRRAQSPLQSRMNRFAKMITIAILSLSALAFGVGLAMGEGPAEMFLTSVSLAVSAMPEGLPVVVTVALAVGARRMAKRGAILRRLPALETLGSCTLILSDKTGTLTQNRMTVRHVWAGEEHFEFAADSIRYEDALPGAGRPAEAGAGSPLYLALLAGALANQATEQDDNGQQVFKGDPTETALLASGKRAGLSRQRLLEEYPLLDEIPFDPDTRFSATIHSRDGRQVAFLKGAPERIAEASAVMAAAGGTRPLDARKVMEEADKMARDGLRVLAMAMVSGDESAAAVRRGELRGLTFLGLQGIIDPPRPEAAPAVAACHRAGIRVMMVTGDNPVTAAAIAIQVGITRDAAAVRTGTQLDQMSDEQLMQTMREISVYARVSPSQKLRLVNLLRRQGEIIAVTGDGVNDAPALKSAHIGAAMGLSGTDVAKEASEMVLTDDNFATIYAAVEEGRTAFSNIRKATFFTLSSGVGEVITILASLALRLPLPLIPAQILWLNVVTNGVEDIGLAFEPGEAELFRRPPRRPKEGILNRLLGERSLIVGLVMAAGTLAVFTWEYGHGATLDYARVAALTTLVTFQIFHVFNSRSEEESAFSKNPLSNRFLFLGVVGSLGAHIGAMYFGPTQFLLGLEPLNLGTWLRLIPVALSIVLAVELHKLARRSAHKR